VLTNGSMGELFSIFDAFAEADQDGQNGPVVIMGLLERITGVLRQGCLVLKGGAAVGG
jgi:hypothetical protein